MSNLEKSVIEDKKINKEDMYLIFSLGKEEYGIEIKYVTEIIGMQEITIIPNAIKHLKGVINLRGKIIPVMDVRIRFNKEFKEYHDRTCIIVICIEDILLGLIVDSVVEVLPVIKEEITKPPNLNKNQKNKYIKGIANSGKKMKLLIDCEKLISEDIEDLNEIA